MYSTEYIYYRILNWNVITVLPLKTCQTTMRYSSKFNYLLGFIGFDLLMITKFQWIVINLALILCTFIYINLRLRPLRLTSLSQQQRDDEQNRKHGKLLYTSSIVIYNRVWFIKTYEKIIWNFRCWNSCTKVNSVQTTENTQYIKGNVKWSYKRK